MEVLCTWARVRRPSPARGAAAKAFVEAGEHTVNRDQRRMAAVGVFWVALQMFPETDSR